MFFSDSSSLKRPHLRTERVNKVMGEALHPMGYILWLRSLQTD